MANSLYPINHFWFKTYGEPRLAAKVISQVYQNRGDANRAEGNEFPVTINIQLEGQRTSLHIEKTKDGKVIGDFRTHAGKIALSMERKAMRGITSGSS